VAGLAIRSVQQQQRGGFRRFLQSPPGKALLIAATILLTFASFVYVQTLIAIPVFLLFGLAVPIWSGLKAPKYLALSGLVVVLLVAPIANAAITQEIMTPLPAASSATGLPFSNGGSAVMQNAAVSPYVGTTSTNFTWTVTIYPQYLPYANSSIDGVALYVSSCPGATSNNSPSCAAGYSLWAFNNTTVKNITSPTNVTFHFQIGSEGIWDWQMELAYRNGTGGNTTYQLLLGDATYNGLEGPVVGNFGSVYESLLPTLYLDVLLFLGIPFYVVLLLYMVFKSREKRKQDAARRAAGPPPDDTGPSVPASASPGGGDGSGKLTGASTAPVVTEGACPSCGAVVYANETTCWKCGAKIGGSSSSAPLPSSPKN
jgi:hypothetical protein